MRIRWERREKLFLHGTDILNILRTQLVKLSILVSHQQLKSSLCTPVLWIRIGLNADPDPAFDLSSDSDPEPGSKANADACRTGTWPDFNVSKSWIFTWKKNNILKVGNRSKNILYQRIRIYGGANAFFKGRKPGLLILVNSHAPGSWSAFPIRIQDSNADSWGSGSTTLAY